MTNTAPASAPPQATAPPVADLMVARAQRGDRDAFRQLVETHSAAIYRVALRITQDRAAAEDVVQETFLKVYQQLDAFDGRARFSTWVHRIAANQAIDAVRRRQRRHEVGELDGSRSSDHRHGFPADGGDGAAERFEHPAPDPLRSLESSEIARATNAALVELSVLERAAFVLRHFEGCSIDEISRALGTRESASKQAVFRAVGKLRRALAPFVWAQPQEAP